MNERTILVTGTPRSGTTLTCFLLNKASDTVALHEPMKTHHFGRLQSHDEISESIDRFCDEQRVSLLQRRRAVTKQVNGVVPDNSVGAERSADGQRLSIVSMGEIVVEKPLSPDFSLVVKHPTAFAAVLGGLVDRFPVYAIVRNPLATLASWNSVSFNVQRGRAQGAERFDAVLTARLDATDDLIDRQIVLLNWFYERFHRHLPESSIIRYESIVESGGAALARLLPDAGRLREPLESRNLSALYDHRRMFQLGERLLQSDGAYWRTYPKESVEELLNALARGDGAHLSVSHDPDAAFRPFDGTPGS